MSLGIWVVAGFALSRGFDCGLPCRDWPPLSQLEGIAFVERRLMGRQQPTPSRTWLLGGSFKEAHGWLESLA